MFLGQLSMSSPFLSTLSLRRATSPCAFRSSKSFYFYPRSPCGERRYSLRHSTQGWHFYPRSPCGERPHRGLRLYHAREFLSTLSLRRATTDGLFFLCAEKHFYPRSPCGERHTKTITPLNQGNFYPRSPCGERPGKSTTLTRIAWISIHALLAESDY